MNNIKQARFVKSSFMFLVISLSMLSSPSIGEAQDNSTECKWVTILMLKPKYNGITNTLEWELEPDSVYICAPAQTETKSAASRGVSNVAPSSFPVSANNALLGTWKYVKYMEQQQYPGVKTTPLIEKMVTITFHQNGVLDFRDQSAFVGSVSFQDINDKLNWKYIPQTDSAGVLEQYKENRIVRKTIIRWISNNQFETSSDEGEKGVVFTREGNNPNSYKSLNESVNIPAIAPLSSSLSIAERLPARLGQFVRQWGGHSSCITPEEKADRENGKTPQIGNPEELVLRPPCPKDQIEVASAFYGDTPDFPKDIRFHIAIEKYGNSGQAAQAMAAKKTDLSFAVVKRQALKNRAGQIVGQLAVLQSSEQGTEVINFTFGEYFYSISGHKRGDAQNALKLLPL